MALGRPLRVARIPVLGLLVASLVLAACGSPNYHYLSSRSDSNWVRVPADWKLYDEDVLLTLSDDSTEQKAETKRLTWSWAFDADPKPSLKHVLGVVALNHPWGIVQARTLKPDQRDTMSLAGLRSIFLGFDPLSDEALKSGEVEVVQGHQIIGPGKLHGMELLLNLKTDAGWVKWRQVALADGILDKVHVLAISCSDKCYFENKAQIDKIVASWKVKER
ncbi:MAG TPA: hypothetical protein VFJ85_04075 [Acidimicrobiales bacterium]|nr:hypothetical protein [Acidimicrobiales bacterium]